MQLSEDSLKLNRTLNKDGPGTFLQVIGAIEKSAVILTPYLVAEEAVQHQASMDSDWRQQSASLID